MFRLVGLMLFILSFGFAGAQPTQLLNQLLQTAPIVSATEANQRIDQLVLSLQEKRKRSDDDFLRLVLRDTYKSFFNTYQPYTQLNDTFETGAYDCLTAVSLVSVVLDRLGFTYQIIETNYHIFLQVETKSGVLLLETTDRYQGVISNPEQIKQKINAYRTQTNQPRNDLLQTSKEHYQFNFNLFQVVKPEQLAGLLYFNQAIVAYNKQDWVTCARKLEDANKIYESARMQEFGNLLVLSIIESDLEESVKKDLIRPFLKYTRLNKVLASR